MKVRGNMSGGGSTSSALVTVQQDEERASNDEDTMTGSSSSFHSREAMLKFIKTTLQPLYNDHTLNKVQFSTVSKATLLHGMQQPYGSYAWSPTGVLDRIVKELVGVGVDPAQALELGARTLSSSSGSRIERQRAVTHQQRGGGMIQPSALIVRDDAAAANRTQLNNGGGPVGSSGEKASLQAHRDAIQSLRSKLAPHLVSKVTTVDREAQLQTSKAAMDSFYRSPNARTASASSAVRERGRASRTFAQGTYDRGAGASTSPPPMAATARATAAAGPGATRTRTRSGGKGKVSPVAGRYGAAAGDTSPVPQPPQQQQSNRPVAQVQVLTPQQIHDQLHAEPVVTSIENTAPGVVPMLINVGESAPKGQLASHGGGAPHTENRRKRAAVVPFFNADNMSSVVSGGVAMEQLASMMRDYEQRQSLMSEEVTLRQQLMGEEVEGMVALLAEPCWQIIRNYLARRQRYDKIASSGATPYREHPHPPHAAAGHHFRSQTEERISVSPIAGGAGMTSNEHLLPDLRSPERWNHPAPAEVNPVLRKLERDQQRHATPEKPKKGSRQQQPSTGGSGGPSLYQQLLTGAPPARHDSPRSGTPSKRTPTRAADASRQQGNSTPGRGTGSYVYTKNPYQAPPKVVTSPIASARAKHQHRGCTSPAARAKGTPQRQQQQQGPSRLEVVEYLRVLLQPSYNEGKLPQSAFTDIVRTVSTEFFTKSWRSGTPAADEQWQSFLRERVLGNGE